MFYKLSTPRSLWLKLYTLGGAKMETYPPIGIMRVIVSDLDARPLRTYATLFRPYFIRHDVPKLYFIQRQQGL